jgi:MFS family permease
MSTEILQAPKLSTSRMLLLGASSVVLCLSYLMAMFTPFPLAMATVLYGRARGYGMVAVGFVVCILLGQFVFLDYTLASSYAGLALFAAVISETVLRSWRPVRSLVITGLVFLAALFGTGYAFVNSQKSTVKEVVIAEVSQVLVRLEEAKKAGSFQQDLADLGLARPVAEIAQDVINTIPGYVFMGVFFVLWVNMYLVLKGRRLLQPDQAHQYDESTLLNFKMPLAGVYAVVAGLALSVWGDQVSAEWGTTGGLVILRAIGVFYFFQGFGVALGFLNHFQIVGFFRTLFVMAVVFFVPWLLALLGLFDTWFDFNQKLKKKVSNFKEPL